MSADALPTLAHANASFVSDRLLVGGDLDQRDDLHAAEQLEELLRVGVTHVVDVRIEADDTEFVDDHSPGTAYLWHGIDDAGQRVPTAWFEEGVAWVLTALDDPDAIVLTHCHMGINRGPSLGYAVMLAQGWDPVEAIAAIRAARPIAYVAYAEDALRWHHARVSAPVGRRRVERKRLAGWRRDNEIDLVRMIARQREAGM